MKILGILDILAALILLSIPFATVPKGLVIVVASLICLKGFVFILNMNMVSIFDIIIGILLFLSLFMTLPSLLLLVVAGYLGVKGVLSLAA